MNGTHARTGTPASSSLRTIKVTFAVIYFLFMLARAVFGPFITLYLQEKGLSPEQIGLVTGINSFAIIVTQPVWGIIADRIQSVKKTLILCLVCQAVFALSLLFAGNLFLIAAAFGIYTSFSSSEGPLMDTWALTSLRDAGDPNGMGRVKMWGCIGFSLSSVLSGIFISRYSTSSIIPFFAALLLLLALCLRFIRTETAAAGGVRLRDMQLHRILRDKAFMVFLAYVFFMQLAHRGSYTFYSLLIKQLGGTDDLVGYASALMFVSEAAVMFLSRKMLSKGRPEMLVVGSSCAFMLWHLFLSLSTHPVHVVLSCLMDGPSFALFTIGCLYYMDKLAPKEIRTTYQTVAYAVYFGLSGIVGNMLSGWLIENMGYRMMYWVGISITLASTVVFCLVRKWVLPGMIKTDRKGA